MSRIRLAAGLFCLVLASSCSEDDAPEPQYLAKTIQAVSGGQVDSSSTSVVGIINQGGGLCTGSLIAPNLVMTAQHCVAPTPGQAVQCGRANFGTPGRPGNFFVTTQTSFPRGANGYYGVREVRVPEIGADLCGSDIAMLVLSRNVPAAEATPLVPRIDHEVEGGDRFTAIGYG